jgi:macrophage erythroblast attacher
LVREEKIHNAIQYARKYLASLATNNIQMIQKEMGALVFRKNSPLYADVFSDARWDQLIEQFKREDTEIHGLPRETTLEICLGCGLAALKTSQCYIPELQNRKCPVCNNDVRPLAENLPYSHWDNSVIICSVTGEVMNEDNFPMLLPSGYICSKKVR